MTAPHRHSGAPQAGSTSGGVDEQGEGVGTGLPAPDPADHTACQAAHNALYEAAVEIMENPPIIESQRAYFDYRLGTMGHLYGRSGWEDIMRERDKWRALCEMVDDHYSGSLDHQPPYVKAIREALDA